jgi:hypothetical protein
MVTRTYPEGSSFYSSRSIPGITDSETHVLQPIPLRVELTWGKWALVAVQVGGTGAELCHCRNVVNQVNDIFVCIIHVFLRRLVMVLEDVERGRRSLVFGCVHVGWQVLSEGVEDDRLLLCVSRSSWGVGPECVALRRVVGPSSIHFGRGRPAYSFFHAEISLRRQLREILLEGPCRLRLVTFMRCNPGRVVGVDVGMGGLWTLIGALGACMSPMAVASTGGTTCMAMMLRRTDRLKIAEPTSLVECGRACRHVLQLRWSWN